MSDKPRANPAAWLASIGVNIAPEFVELLLWVRDRIPEPPAKVLDVGYGWGVSTMLWLDQFPRARVVTVDPMMPGQYAKVCPTFNLAAKDMGRWTFVHGKLELVGSHLVPPYGFIFVDADHAYDSTVAQISACWEMLQPGGVMAGHDTLSHPKEVGRAVAEFAAYWGLPVEYCEIDAGAWLIRKDGEE